MDGWKAKEADDCLVDSLPSIATAEESDFATPKLLLASVQTLHAPADGLTTPAPWLTDDIKALLKLSAFELPPLRVVRPSRVVHVYYGFGDASGKQFGATILDGYSCKLILSWERQDNHGVRFRIGLWSATKEK